MRTFISIAAMLFFFSELANVILRRSKRKEVKIKKDRLSLVLLWTTIGISTISAGIIANLFPFSERSFSIELTGIIIFLLGLIIRWTAIIQLGKMFTVNVSISHDHKIKADGLFRYIRHPSYLGLILEFLGFSLLYNSWYPLLIINIPIFIVLIYRMNIEESLLISHFGDDYKTYLKHTKRIIPLIY